MEIDNTNIPIFQQLNESQRKAVEFTDGPELVIAGAGSGKTRVLTAKIAYLLTLGMKPWEIMAITFTNKAAREMKERIADVVGESMARYLRMGTFHSVFSRILRAEAASIGYTSNFTIYDEADSKSLCKAVIKELGLDEKIYKPSDIHCRISGAKNNLITAEAYLSNGGLVARDAAERVPQVATIYKLYQERCKVSNAMDFDDLLLNTYLLFKNNEEVRMKYALGLQYILVDEYQDTNFAQQKIIYLLASEHKKVCVVGDDAQSIYSFRGANIDNILDFQSQYDGAMLFKLEQNYRSTQIIVEAANSLIHKNEWQIKKTVFSENVRGAKLCMQQLSSDREEALCVCKDIKEKMGSGDFTYSDFAILYRTNYQSRTFEEQFLKSNMPYRIHGGLSFYQRKEIKDITAYFRLVANHDDEEALKRVINYPARGIGDTTVGKIALAAHEAGISMWQTICQPESTTLNVNKGVLNKLALFRALIEGFTERLQTDDAFVLGKEIVRQSGISQELYSSNDPEYLSRQENMQEFLSSMQEFVDSAREEGNPVGLLDFLQDVSLLSDKEDANDDTPRITLMTIHSAKGLEFPCVYVVGLEENIFPSPMADTKRKLEEERRLLYVAITRAEQHCMLTFAKSRYRYGRMEFDAPSRFLKDIDPNLIEEKGTPTDIFRRAETRPRMSSSFGGGYERRCTGGGYNQNYRSSGHDSGSIGSGSSDAAVGRRSTVGNRVPVARASASPAARHLSAGELKLGMAVKHDRFGVGVITGLDGSGDSAKATVEFENAGMKQLLLKFARLQILRAPIV